MGAACHRRHGVLAPTLPSASGGGRRQLQLRQRLECPARLAAPFGLQRRQVAPLPQLAPMLVGHAQVHEQVQTQHVELEVGALDVQRGFIACLLQKHVDQPAALPALFLQKELRQPLGVLGQGHEAAARALRQAFEQRLDLVLEHARHQPFGALLAHLVQHEQRHRHGDAVARVARAVQVAGGAVHAAQLHGLGELVGGDARRLVAHQLVARQHQQARLLLAGGAQPLVEGRAAVDALGNGPGRRRRRSARRRPARPGAGSCAPAPRPCAWSCGWPPERANASPTRPRPARGG